MENSMPATQTRDRLPSALWLMQRGIPDVMRLAVKKRGRAPDLVYVIRLWGSYEGVWTLALGRCRLTPGSVRSPDFVLEMESSDFELMCAGRLDAALSFTEGRLRFQGELGLLAPLADYLNPLVLP